MSPWHRSPRTRHERRRHEATPSVQEVVVAPREILFGDLVALAAPGTPLKRTFVAVLQVEGLPFGLKSSEEQERLLTQFRALIHSLSHEVQIVVQARPLDLQAYRAQFASGFSAEQDIASANRDLLRQAHLEHLETLARERTLIARQFSLIVPADSQAPALLPVRRWWPGARSAARSRLTAYRQVALEAQQQVTLRLRELQRYLSALGLHTQRLQGPALVAFLAQSLLIRRPPLPLSLQQALSHPQNQPVLLPAGTLAPAAPGDAALLAGPRIRRWPWSRRRSVPVSPRMAPPAVALASPAWVQLADVLAPSSLTVGPSALALTFQEREWVCCLVVHEVARDAPPGWLRPLLELDEPALDVSLHVHPRSQQEALRLLRRKQTTQQAARLVAARRGTILDAHVYVGERDVGALLLAVAGGEERLADVTLCLLVRASSRQELEARTRRVLALLNTLSVTRVASFLQDEGFLSSLPYAQDRLGPRWGSRMLLDSTSIAHFFPFMSNALYLPTGVLYGVTTAGDPIVIDRWHDSFQNANCLIDGPSGYGKSFLCKLLVLRLLLQRRPRQVLITDPDREYKRLCQTLGGQWIRLAAGSGYRINPLELTGSAGLQLSALPTYQPEDDTVFAEAGDPLAEKVARLLDLFQIMLARRGADGALVPLSPEEMGLLEMVLFEAYRRVGITSKSTAYGRQAPLLRDVYDILDKAVFGPDTFGLRQRLYPYVSGSYRSLFEGPTNIQLDAPLLVFDTRDLDSRLAPVVLAMLSEIVWTRAFASDLPREFLIDEAGSLAGYEAWARFMAQIVTRARKHFLAVTLILQNIESLQQSQHAQVILDNCDLKILLGRSRTETLRTAYALSEQEEEQMRLLGRGEGLLLTPTRRLVARFEANPLEYDLATTRPDDLAAQRQLERLARLDVLPGAVAHPATSPHPPSPLFQAASEEITARKEVSSDADHSQHEPS